MKILLVDDHALVRRGLRELLAEEFPPAQFFEAGNAQDALELTRKQPLALLVLDVTLPGTSGLDILPDIRKARPDLPVVVVSMHPETEFALRALKAGARAYLNKRTADTELVAAVRKVLLGGHYVTPAVAEKLADVYTQKARGTPHDQLSDREFNVLRRLAGGETVKDIAAALRLSPKTVSTYRTRVLKKLGVTSTAELARYALENDLIE